MSHDESPVTAVVHVAYHQLPFTDEGAIHGSGPRTGEKTGLVHVGDGWFAVVTGAAWGVVNLAVEVLPRAPRALDLDRWEAAVEVSVESSGTMIVDSHEQDVPEHLPILTRDGPGSYRVRVFARGRSKEPDAVAREPLEDYLVQVWPAPSTQELVHKVDEYGRFMGVSE